MIKTKAGTELPMLNLKGKEYLAVAHRLLWMREDQPEWSVETELLKYDHEYALFKAVIKNDKGVVISTAHQDCFSKEFPDHIAKAETSAIGRALAIAGYGTQFAQELEEETKISDAPLTPKKETSPATSLKPQKPSQPKLEPRVFESYKDAYNWPIPIKSTVQGKKLGEIDKETLVKIKQHCHSASIQSQEMLDLIEACRVIDLGDK